MAAPPPASPLRLAVRSVAWACLMPGVLTGVVPWWLFGVSRARLDPAAPLHLLGLALVALGVALLGACVWDFARRGHGTLAPVDPPTALVVHGPYRRVRNPMYVAVFTIVLGELAIAPSVALLLYGVVGVLATHLFVVRFEEPALRRQFGAAYNRYTRAVPRWVPSLRPFDAAPEGGR